MRVCEDIDGVETEMAAGYDMGTALTYFSVLRLVRHAADVLPPPPASFVSRVEQMSVGRVSSLAWLRVRVWLGARAHTHTHTHTRARARALTRHALPDDGPPQTSHARRHCDRRW